MLGLHGAAVPGGTCPERAHDLGLEVADDELSHNASNDSTRRSALGIWRAVKDEPSPAPRVTASGSRQVVRRTGASAPTRRGGRGGVARTKKTEPRAANPARASKAAT